MNSLPEGYELRDYADPAAAHAFLTESYWAKGISLESVSRALAASIPVSIWHQGRQVAMARVLTDYVSMAYINDVYVLPEHGGKGLAQAMIAWLRGQPALQDVGRWALFTKDAQSLYAKLGFRQYPYPERMMIIDPKVIPQ
ncbi:MAG: GNAT family N-acetyltransferase [Novosphingobium sp.]